MTSSGNSCLYSVFVVIDYEALWSLLTACMSKGNQKSEGESQWLGLCL